MMSPIANRTAAMIASMIRLLRDVAGDHFRPYGGEGFQLPSLPPATRLAPATYRHDAGRLWAGGVTTAAVAGLVALMGVVSGCAGRLSAASCSSRSGP